MGVSQLLAHEQTSIAKGVKDIENVCFGEENALMEDLLTSMEVIRYCSPLAKSFARP